MARGKYKRKREKKKQEMSVEKLGLSTRVLNLLKKNGVLTIADLTMRSKAELLALNGIGASAISEIQSRLQIQDIVWEIPQNGNTHSIVTLDRTMSLC